MKWLSRPKKLSQKILVSMAMRLTGLVLLTGLLTHGHLMALLGKGAEDSLEKYAIIRGQREEFLFINAEKNHEVLTAEFSFRLRVHSQMEIDQRFQKLVKKYEDGHYRNHRRISDGVHGVGVYIQKDAVMTPEFRRKIVVSYDLLSEFGPAMHAQFQDTYFTFPEKAIVIYWPEAPNWVFEIKPDYQIEREEWFQLGDLQAHKGERTGWTGTFFDSVSKTWMITAATPMIANGKFIGSVHHDVTLDEIFRRTIRNSLTGTYTYIVRDDGRLIAHPEYQDEIEATHGKYFVANNDRLKAELETILHSNQVHGILDLDGKTDALVGYSFITGPNWYLVSFYPKSVLRTTASSTILFMIIVGALSLIFELVIVFVVLRNQVTGPLSKLVTATEKISRGEFDLDLDTKRQDELGDFARTFVAMKDVVQDRDLTLEKHNRNLEVLVNERTRELEQERLQKIQASKMATLGEMASNIAHEVNTPLAAIQMRANQIQEMSELQSPDFHFYTECAQSIDRTVERVAKIIRGLRKFSRDGSTSPYEVVSVSDILQDTLDLASERFKNRGIGIRVSTEPFDLKVECRSVQISQVLLNLLNNACDALDDQKEKWIQVKAILNRKSQQVEISVTDSGHGIPYEHAENIMQPFFTTKGVGKGTGLGLSISRNILFEHKGDLYLDTGSIHTRFVMVMPQIQRQKQAA